MKQRKQFARALFFVFLLACLLTGMAGTLGAPAQAAPGMQVATNVVISEFRTRGPSGAADEFIEIYNPTNGPIPIGNWQVRALTAGGSEATRATIPAGINLESGQYYLIANTGYAGAAVADLTYGTGIIDDGGIAIFDNSGNRIDSVGLNTNPANPYTEGAPLVSLTTNVDRSYQRNLGGASDSCQDTGNNSADFQEITPSNPQNSTSPLRLCGLILPTSTPTGTATSTGTITITPSVTNTLPAGTAFPFLSLLINEVAWAGTASGLSSDEWIELHNPGSSPINLTGWVLRGDDNSPNIALSGSIPGGGYYLLERTDDTTVSDIPADLIYTGELNNSGEILRLYDPTGSVVDIANSNGGAWPAGTTTITATSTAFGTMERRGVMADSDIAWITNTGVVANGLAANGVALKGTPKNRNWAVQVTPTVSLTPSRTRTPTRTPTITRTPTRTPPPPLVAINEFVPRPGHDWNGDGVVNVGDEYIELLNHGVVDVDLVGWTLDDEINIGSTPYRIPSSMIVKPGERVVFFQSETGLLLSDGGDGVRLTRPNGTLADAYNYRVVRHPDHAYCRYPDNGGADDWNTNCYPTPRLQNSLSAVGMPTPQGGIVASDCPLSDTQPDDFIWAECQPFGQRIFRPAYWDRFGWYGERYLPESPGKWPVFAD